MRTKPMWAATGMLLSGALLSGCSFSRNTYDGGYPPPPAPASVSYSQVPGWTANPSRSAASAYQPVVTPASASTKADGGPMEVMTSLQLVNGTAGTTNPTPMLTITLPAVKFLVPVTGSYSFGGRNGENSTTATATNPDANVHTVNQAAPAQTSTIQYMVPATTAAQPTVQYMPAPPTTSSPQHLPAFNPPSSNAPKSEETPEMKPAPANAAPIPNWPADAAGAEPATPPPPPPISRPPAGLPKGQ